MEGCRRQEGIGRQRCFGNTQQNLFTLCRSFSFFHQLFVNILKFQDIHQGARQEVAVAVIFHTDFLQHLTYDHLDVFIVDLHTLQTIYSLHFLKQIILYGAHTLDLQNIMRVDASFCQGIAGFHVRAVHDLDT